MGVVALGYVGLSVSDAEAWSRFAVEVLGLMPADVRDGVALYRTDERAWRIAVHAGGRDDLAYVGLEVATLETLDALAGRLSDAGVACKEADATLRVQRGVTRLVCCTDPDGLAVELYCGAAERRDIPFASPVGGRGFLTGDQGLGHVVLATPEIDRSSRFYRGLLGFKLSDIITLEVGPAQQIEMEFLHCNARHHSLALAPLKLPKKLLHFMLQTETLDDVGFALQRARAARVQITAELGRHTNDLMLSFYARTPSGFEVEYGWGARTVDADWRVARHDKTSLWGHDRRETGD